MNHNLNRDFIAAQKAKISAVYGNGPTYVFEKSDAQENEPLVPSGATNFTDHGMAKAEGDHGGRVLGHTQSGKAIYDTPAHPGHANYSAQDHLDASAAHGEAYKTNPNYDHRIARFDHLKEALK